ncbi:hypothetical protein AAC387_Pa09g0859 [Persea americana]
MEEEDDWVDDWVARWRNSSKENGGGGGGEALLQCWKFSNDGGNESDGKGISVGEDIYKAKKNGVYLLSII